MKFRKFPYDSHKITTIMHYGVLRIYISKWTMLKLMFFGLHINVYCIIAAIVNLCDFFPLWNPLQMCLKDWDNICEPDDSLFVAGNYNSLLHLPIMNINHKYKSQMISIKAWK